MRAPHVRSTAPWMMIAVAVAGALLSCSPHPGTGGNPSAAPEVNEMSGEAHGQRPFSRLTDAVVAGDVGEVDRLLGSGADPNSRDPSNVPALAIAASRKHAAIVRSLLRAGADPNQTVYVPARGLFDAPILAFPAGNGGLEVLDALLNAGADPGRHDRSGATPLMAAAFRGHEAVVGRLIASGADLEARDEEGQTALMFASNAGQL